MDGVKDNLDQLVEVTDKAGKKYICPMQVLLDPDNCCTEEELNRCFSPAEGAFSDDEARAIFRSAAKKLL
jgi:hypothetical protein